MSVNPWGDPPPAAPEVRDEPFVKLFRAIRQTECWCSMNAGQRNVWIEIILDASWTSRRDPETGVLLRRGEVIQNESKWARQAKVGRETVRSAVRKLRDTHEAVPVIPTSDPTTQHKVLRLANYDGFRQSEDGAQPALQPATNQRPTTPPPEIAAPQAEDRAEEGEEREKDQEQEVGVGVAAPREALAAAGPPPSRECAQSAPSKAIGHERCLVDLTNFLAAALSEQYPHGFGLPDVSEACLLPEEMYGEDRKTRNFTLGLSRIETLLDKHGLNLVAHACLKQLLQGKKEKLPVSPMRWLATAEAESEALTSAIGTYQRMSPEAKKKQREKWGPRSPDWTKDGISKPYLAA